MRTEQQRFRFAKHRYSAACEAFLRGDPGAVEQCTRALDELNQARAALESKRLPHERRAAR
jgi:hypothetical protein